MTIDSKVKVELLKICLHGVLCQHLSCKWFIFVILSFKGLLMTTHGITLLLWSRLKACQKCGI